MSNPICGCPSMQDGQGVPEHFLCLICSWLQFTEEYYRHNPSVDRNDMVLIEVLNIWWIRYRKKLLGANSPGIQPSQAYDLSNIKLNVSARWGC